MTHAGKETIERYDRKEKNKKFKKLSVICGPRMDIEVRRLSGK